MPIIFPDGVETEISQEQYDAMIVAIPPSADQVRKERDTFLASTDWWATSDRTMTAEQTAYRQALRDVTGQAGFPANVTWPTKP